MDVYHIWCSLKQGIGDLEFSDALRDYFTYLQSDGRLHGYRITRRKLGLGHPQLPEWHIMLEFENLTQLDDAFNLVSSRAGDAESRHHAVNSKIAEVTFALYRDFPDDNRKRGEEQF